MKKVVYILAIVFVVLLVLAAAGFFIADQKYGLLAAPRISHEEILKGRPTIRIVAKPNYAEALLLKLMPPDTQIQPGSLKYVMIPEIAALFAPDIGSGVMDISIFANELRFGPLITEMVNSSRALSSITYVAWAPPGVKRIRRGELLAEGSIALPEPVITGVINRWGYVQPLTPPRVEGEHLLEAVMDNRDGGTYAAIMAILAHNGVDIQSSELRQLGDVLALVAMLRLDADLNDDGTFSIHFTIAGKPDAKEGEMNTVAFVLRQPLEQLAELAQEYGLRLEGGIERQALDIVGNYVLYDSNAVASLIQQYL